MKSILLEQAEIDIVKKVQPNLIVEEKKSGMFIRCFLREGTLDTEIYALGRLVAIKESNNKK